MTLLPPAIVPTTVNVSSNPIYGAQGQPHYITNAYYQPQGYFPANGTSVTTTINRVYYVPFAIWEAHTFQGSSTFNSGTGDNGEHIRMMMFFDNGVGGGPGALAKDFGEITLTGASAQRTLVSSWSATAGMYWAAIWHETAASMCCMDNVGYTTAVGSISGVQPSNFMGTLTYTPTLQQMMSTWCHYVDTAYGAAPATAVAPTASILAGPSSGLVPLFSLKA